MLVGGVARVLELFVESDVVAAVEAWKGACGRSRSCGKGRQGVKGGVNGMGGVGVGVAGCEPICGGRGGAIGGGERRDWAIKISGKIRIAVFGEYWIFSNN